MNRADEYLLSYFQAIYTQYSQQKREEETWIIIVVCATWLWLKREDIIRLHTCLCITGCVHRQIIVLLSTLLSFLHKRRVTFYRKWLFHIVPENDCPIAQAYLYYHDRFQLYYLFCNASTIMIRLLSFIKAVNLWLQSRIYNLKRIVQLIIRMTSKLAECTYFFFFF